jgi:hypothetical protein
MRAEKNAHLAKTADFTRGLCTGARRITHGERNTSPACPEHVARGPEHVAGRRNTVSAGRSTVFRAWLYFPGTGSTELPRLA